MFDFLEGLLILAVAFAVTALFCAVPCGLLFASYYRMAILATVVLLLLIMFGYTNSKGHTLIVGTISVWILTIAFFVLTFSWIGILRSYSLSAWLAAPGGVFLGLALVVILLGPVDAFLRRLYLGPKESDRTR